MQPIDVPASSFLSCVISVYDLHPFLPHPVLTLHNIFGSAQTCMTMFCSANPLLYQKGFNAADLRGPDMTQQTPTSKGRLQVGKFGPL
jgi:hypothetical protein